MRISPLFRLTALWALLVFAVGWSEDALVLHPCPHHAAIAQAGAAAHGGHGDAHHADAGQTQHGEHQAPAHSGCSCVVACAGTAYVPASPRGEVRLAAAVFRSVPAFPARAAAALPGRREHVLPFPTAPPVLPS